MRAADQTLLELIAEEVLQPDTIRLAIDEAVSVLTAARVKPDRRSELEQALAILDGETARLTSAIAAGGSDLAPLLGAIRQRQEQKDQLLKALRACDGVSKPLASDRASIEEELRCRLADWRGFLGRQTVWSRQILTKMLSGRVLFAPTTIHDSGIAAYEIRVPLTYDRLFAGLLYPQGMASPSGCRSNPLHPFFERWARYQAA